MHGMEWETTPLIANAERILFILDAMAIEIEEGKGARGAGNDLGIQSRRSR